MGENVFLTNDGFNNNNNNISNKCADVPQYRGMHGFFSFRIFFILFFFSAVPIWRLPKVQNIT